MKKKEVIIIGDHVHFEDGHIKLISNKDKLFTRIEHKASIKYLNNIKDKIFKNSFFRLTFEGNRLVENLNSFRFLSKIEKAKEIYFFKTNKKILRPNKSKGITSKHLDIKINKDEYISYLTTLHCKDTAIITISENINGVFSDSILFQIKTVSDETIFLWETVNESSKATYTFISNNEFHKEVLNRIQSFLESKNIQSKRSCIKENTNLQTWLSFIKTIHHTEISIYKAEIENLLTTSRFIKQNFEYQSTQDYSNVNKILLESVFVDSFLKFKQNIYLIDGGLNLKITLAQPLWRFCSQLRLAFPHFLSSKLTISYL
jgi:hypothetical protein